MEKVKRESRAVAAGLLAVLLSAAPAAAAAAETAELVTDRPDQTESAETVPPGTVQVETGVVRAEGDGGESDARRDEIGATLLRFGLVDRWELRLAWGGWQGGGDADGAADAGLGCKWRLAESASGATTVALLASTSVPVGDAAITSDRFDPELRLSVAHELARRLSLGWNVGAAIESTLAPDGRRRSDSLLFATAALGLAATPRVGLFLELFGEGGGSRGGPPATSLDGGATFRLRPNAQLDLAAGVGLSRAAADLFATVGFSIRLPG